MRRRIPGLVMRSTLIVGLPGETEEKFARLLETVKQVRFERLGVFTYSDEEHALSSRLDGKVPKKRAKERQKELMLAQQRIAGEWSRSKIGETIEVLVEGPTVCRSVFDAPEIDCKVLLKWIRDAAPGSFLRARVVGSEIYDLVAEPLSTDS